MDQRTSGVFTTADALASGLSVDQVKARRRRGAFVKVLGRGLVAAGQHIGPWQMAWSAHVTCPTGVIGGQLAAVLLGFPVPVPDEAMVILPAPRRSVAGMQVVVMDLGEHERFDVDGLPITTPTRTALDCLSRLDRQLGMRVLTWSVTRGLVSRADGEEFVQRRFGMHGNPEMRFYLRFLRTQAAGPMELRLHQGLARGGASGWRANVPIVLDGVVVACGDVVFEEEKLVVEVDGARVHVDEDADAARDHLVSLAGYRVLRFPAAMVGRHGRWVLWSIRKARAERRAELGLEPLAELDAPLWW